MWTLGIESSCDETAAAVVDEQLKVHSNVVFSQIARHQAYGGVVPEIASRCHVEVIGEVLRRALAEAGISAGDVGQVAVTRGPGLASSLLVGVQAAKAFALQRACPLLPVNHLVGHVYALFLDRSEAEALRFPLLILLVSGGHTLLLEMEEDRSLHRLGTTLDDAAGEALDKGANRMGLGYPGGPEIEKVARENHAEPIRLTGAQHLKRTHRTGALDPALCFSFSGLKTALLCALRDHPEWMEPERFPALCSGYQDDVFSGLLGPVERALRKKPYRGFACVGGVARNARLRVLLSDLSQRHKVHLALANPAYCTDNAAMIAGAAAAGAADAVGSPLEMDIVPNLKI